VGCSVETPEDTTEAAAVPEAVLAQVQRLGAAAWRERKASVEALCEVVRQSDTPMLRSLAELLLDGMRSSEAIDGRSACHEVLVTIGAPALDGLLRRLEMPGPGRRLLVDLLGEIGDEQHVRLLGDIARDSQSDANVRAAAATALGALGGATAERALRELLARASDVLCVHALDALRSLEAKVPVEELEPLVAAKLTRKAATAVLGSSGDLAALPVLLPLLDDPMAGVRATTVVALVGLDARLQEQGKPGLVAAALVRVGEQTRTNLRHLIEHRDREVRAAAIVLSAMAGDARAVATVLEVMDDPLIQEQAMAMVATLGDAAASALADAAERASGAQREHVLRLVGALPAGRVDPRLVTALMAGLHEPDEDAAAAAAEALERAGDRSCLGELYRALGTEGRLGEAAADAMAAILRRAGRAAHEDLQLIVGASWPEQGALARNLCRVVGGLTSQRFAPHLVSMLGSADVGVRIAAATALGQLAGEHEGGSALSFALADEEPAVRAAACRSLGQLGVPHAVQSLLSATADPSPLVRSAAVQALVILDNPVALAKLRAIIADDPVPSVVVHAIAGLGSSGLDQDLTMLMSLCTSQDHEVVKAAARALARFSAHRATAALLGLLVHGRWDVRWTAAEVLAQRGDETALDPLQRCLVDEEDTLVRQVLEQALSTLRVPVVTDPEGQ
jgi:HEAT repeat protein